ncbi:MAG TPA: M13 family metallopeptidase [Usitatibacter sp.]|nr:M13 family metallopeptidase [Usitatibacter sp.]
MKRNPVRILAAAILAALSLPAASKLDVAGLDRGIDPCTDFYGYANRIWIASTPVPADRARWGPMDMIARDNQELLRGILDKELRKGRKDAYKYGSDEWKALSYYQSGMNDNRREYHAMMPVETLLKDIAAVATPAEIAAMLGRMHANGLGGAFDFSVDADRRDSTRYLAEITQAGLGLPDRDYYFRDDDKTKALRAGYLSHVEKMFVLIGESPQAAKTDAAKVFALETDLARASMTAVERRDVEKTYNKRTRAQLAALAPGLPWDAYFKELGAPDTAELNIAQLEYLEAVGRLVQERTADWPAYLRWHAIHATSGKLSPAFVNENFDFYERQLRGVQTQPPTYREVLRDIGGPYGNRGVGMALGKLYVEAAFPPQAKKRAEELVANIKAALRERLKAAAWMGEATRTRALAKLDAMQVKVGYPDHWRDYSRADIKQAAYAENWMAANRFDSQREIARIGKPVDRAEWFMAPYVVNAYYNPTGNEIVFPAAILQPPYFDATADDAINYGGIGMVIGHEITHGFDNRGRRFDQDGNMRDWWGPEDEKRYNERAKVIETQYGAMSEVDGVKPNGTLTLGENIADVGGLKIAYDALQKALKGKARDKIDGLTPEQRFFISWAQGWKSNARTEYERNQVLTGQHSLPRFRVDGPIAHMPEFAKAFSCDASKTLLPGITQSAIW